MPGSDFSADPLGELFDVVAGRTGCDFSQYKSSTLGRRVEQRFRRVGCADVASYRAYVEDHPDETAKLQRHLLIGVTSFFRNPRAFERLGEEWDRKWSERPPGAVRIWIPACSTGEEAYSLALLAREILERRAPETQVHVFATDLDPRAIDRARKGWYTDGALTGLERVRISRWFEREDRGWRVRKELRDSLTFAVHNLLSDPPFGQLDLISCRNLFIYLNQEVQTRLTGSFAFSLKPGGLLLLGTSESVDVRRVWFDPLDKKNKLYRRRTDTRARPQVPAQPPVIRERMNPMPASPSAPRDLTVKELVLDLIARDYAVPSVLVDAAGSIQFVWGDTARIFRRRAGRPTDLVVENMVEPLQVALANALNGASTERRTVVVEGLRLPEPDARPVRMTVRPVESPVLGSPHFLIVFQILEESDRGSAPQGADPAQDRRVEELERELNDTRLYLRNLVLKLENANEELAAGNEETQSMNEELQSSNEELESSREELQATNDELETVNATLARRIDELGKLNNDMANLITSARVGILFLDRQQGLQRYTPEAGTLLGLRDSDLGRVFPAVAGTALGPGLEGQLDRVLRDLQPEEREVEVRSRTVLVRILPYRTSEHRIEGLVLTLGDLTELRAAEAERRTVENQFHALFQNNPDAILLGEALWDAEHRVTDFRVERINPAFAAWRQIEPSAIEGKTNRETGRADGADRLDAIGRAIDTGKPQSFRFQSPVSGKHLKTMAIPLGGDRFALLIEDITESVNQQESLRESEALFRSTLTSMDDFVSVIDREGRYVNFFQAHRRGDLYLNPEEFLGKRIDELAIPQAASDAQIRGFASVVAGDPVSSWTYSLPYQTGTRWFSARLTPRQASDGTFAGAVQVSRDITERIEAESALAERESQLRAVFEASPLGLLLIRDGIIVRANASVHRMFEADNLEGAPLERLLVRESQLQGLRGGSNTFPLKLDLVEVEPGVHVGVAQDLTERQRMERTVLNSQRLESLGVLAGGIAHDFNNLLGGLFGFIQLARKATPDNAPSVRHLDRAFSAFGRAQDLTRQLLTFSKGGEPIKRIHDMRVLLEESTRFILSGGNLKLELSVSSDLWPCEVDRHQIGQVIDNLGLNARQALPTGGTVRLTASNRLVETDFHPGLEPGPYLLVTFADDGPGIAPEVLPRIFDPFFSTKKEGSGLGLATVESILRKHGGLIEVESKPGCGATFRLWFPAVPQGAEGRGEVNRRLLVLDDEELILDTALELLEDLGYEAVGVKDGVTAVEAFRQARRMGNRFGFVLTDLTLPGEKGGLAVLEQLRRIDPGLRAAASSGYSDDPVMADPSAWGLEGFLPKPYTRDQLAAFLDSVFPLNPAKK